MTEIQTPEIEKEVNLIDIKDKIVRVKVRDLKFYPDNPRKHTKDQIEKLVNRIKEIGFNQPLIIDEKKQVLVGNGRLEAADQLSMDEVPCIIYEGLSDAQKKQMVIVDNKLNDLSSWDDDILGEWLNDIVAEDLETYFNTSELTNLWEKGDTKNNAYDEWRKHGGLDYSNEDKSGIQDIIMHFRTKEDIQEFGKLLNQTITSKTKYLWFPKHEVDKVSDLQYEEE